MAIVAHNKILVLEKGTLYNAQNKIQRIWMALQFQIVWTILDAVVFCVRIIIDAAKI